MKKVTERLNLHDGNTPYNPPEFYNFHDGKILAGFALYHKKPILDTIKAMQKITISGIYMKLETNL